LSAARGSISALATFEKVFFAGGDAPANSSAVDVYDIKSNSWSILNMANGGIVSTASVGNKIFWLMDAHYNGPGGVYNIEIYDLTTRDRSFASTYWPTFAPYSKILTRNNNLLFINGIYSGLPLSFIDIYDVSTDRWSTAQLNQSLYGSTIVSSGDKIFVFGGEGELANKIWTLEF